MPQSRFGKLQFSNRKSARIDDKLIVFLSIRFEFSIIENHPTTSFEKVQYSERRFNSFLRFVLSHSLKNQSSRAEKLHDLCEFSKPSLSLSLWGRRGGERDRSTLRVERLMIDFPPNEEIRLLELLAGFNMQKFRTDVAREQGGLLVFVEWR